MKIHEEIIKSSLDQETLLEKSFTGTFQMEVTLNHASLKMKNFRLAQSCGFRLPLMPPLYSVQIHLKY